MHRCTCTLYVLVITAACKHRHMYICTDSFALLCMGCLDVLRCTGCVCIYKHFNVHIYMYVYLYYGKCCFTMSACIKRHCSSEDVVVLNKEQAFSPSRNRSGGEKVMVINIRTRETKVMVVLENLRLRLILMSLLHLVHKYMYMCM